MWTLKVWQEAVLVAEVVLAELPRGMPGGLLRQSGSQCQTVNGERQRNRLVSGGDG
jgi:hypothetical protein